MPTVQQIANMTAWMVQTGRGQHDFRPEPRGLREALQCVGSGKAELEFVIEDQDEMIDDKHKVVRLSARIVERGHE